MKVELQCGDTIAIPDGCKAIIEDDLITIIEEKQEEFKEGDILHSINTNRMLIFKKYRENSKLLFSDYFNNARGSNSDDWFTNKFRLATEDEKQALFDKMKEQGLKWNAEKKRVEKIRWRAEDGKDYFIVSSQGKIVEYEENNNCIDEDSYEFGNYFRTEEQAKEAAKRMKEVLYNYHKKITE